MIKKVAKTNAIRYLDQHKITYETFTYESDGALDGIHVAKKIGQPIDHVFKTLVTTAGKGHYFVFIILVTSELNLKLAARVANVKKVEMVAVKELLPLTGYIRGGCSPIGMRKQFPTFIDADAQKLNKMIVSAGKIGLQIKLAPKDLCEIVSAQFADVT